MKCPQATPLAGWATVVVGTDCWAGLGHQETPIGEQHLSSGRGRHGGQRRVALRGPWGSPTLALTAGPTAKELRGTVVPALGHCALAWTRSQVTL